METLQTIEEIHRLFPTTGSNPALVTCNDFRYWVCKYDRSPLNLFNELIAAKFAEIWRLMTPEVCFIQVKQDHVPLQKFPQLQYDLFDKECFGSLYLEDSKEINKRIVNDVKVTDHHGLLITEKIPSELTAHENVIYDMIAHRLLEALSPACTKEITDIGLQALHYDFTLKGCKILEAGWRGIKEKFTDEDGDPVQELPELKVGDELKIKEASVLEKKTKPPVPYTEAGLLSAMENAGKEINIEDERKALKDIGIGTPATRASIIETLFKRDYIRREKKSLIPTDKGLQVYGAVKDRKIADVAMTAEWEMALQKIENNEAYADAFHRDMEAYATSITRELLDTGIAKEKQPELTCPKCKSHQLLIWNKVVKCPDEACGWLQFRTVCGVPLSLTDIESLVTQGKTNLIKGMKSNSGNKFNAYMVMNDNAKTSFEFDNRKQKRK
ncbi:type IA DNA topoisomerase [Sphingobacterium sp. N143]|uniref:type IA DNA topoisomerase n=1 Tax=Sphingobacterium sp. N143 TaxID=2746727 RepID=UPI0025777BEC|nr:type IA DNA topoisomerase [Sphingobacterium sp. N143]